MRPAVLCVLWLFAAGCTRNVLRTGGEGAVTVEAVRLSFQPGDRGDLELDLKVKNPGLPAGALTFLEWELWLGNRWFAAGERQLAEPLPLDGVRAFGVALPIVFHRTRPAKETPRALDVGVKGTVTIHAGGSTQRYPFQTRQQVVARNAPVLNPGLEE